MRLGAVPMSGGGGGGGDWKHTLSECAQQCHTTVCCLHEKMAPHASRIVCRRTTTGPSTRRHSSEQPAATPNCTRNETRDTLVPASAELAPHDRDLHRVHGHNECVIIITGISYWFVLLVAYVTLASPMPPPPPLRVVVCALTKELVHVRVPHSLAHNPERLPPFLRLQHR